MSHGQSSITREQPAASVTGANNGVSVSNKNVVLGNDLGATDAQLVSDREIPLNGFMIRLSGSGKTLTGVLNIQQDAAILAAAPDILVTAPGNIEQGRIRFLTNVAGDAGSIFIGRNAGILQAAAGGATLIGFRTGENAVVSNITAVGYECLTVGAAGSGCVAFGSQALHNATGIENCAVGRNTILFSTIAKQNTVVGNLAGPQVWAGLASDNNTFLGFAAGLGSASTAFTATGNIMIGALCFGNTGGGYGNNNICIGFSCVQAGASGSLGSNNQLIGANIVASGISNTTIIGQGITCNLSNVVALGRSDQNVTVCATNLGSDFGSKLNVIGSLSVAERTTAVNATLDLNDFTIVLTAGALVITLPAANAAKQRIYAIINQAAASTTSINYTNFAGAAVNTIAANAALWLQSDGTNWIRIV